MSLFRRVGLLTAAALISSLLVALPGGPAHADYDLGVTWPDVSDVNPHVTDYQITVIDSGPGDLYARWGSYHTIQPIPHSGVATIDLPFNGTERIEVWRCVDGSCEWAGVSSPILSVHNSVDASLWVTQSRVTSPSTVEAQLSAYSFPGLALEGFDWELRNAGSDVLATGAGPLSAGLNTFEVAVPSGLADGGYTIAVDVHESFAGGPLLGADLTQPLIVDNTPPVVTVTTDLDVVFPYVDSYRDYLTLHVAADEQVSYAFELLDENGDSLGTPSLSTASQGPIQDLWWGGRTASGRVPVGIYRLRVLATDLLGHTATVVSPPVRVDLAQRKTLTMRTELPAAKIVYDRFVGKCSTLAKPSSHRWKDSLGLYSQTKCTNQKNDASVVVMWSAWWLPTAMRGLKSFDRVGIDAYGGAAVGHRNAYLVAGLIDNRGRFSGRQQFSGKVGWHYVGSATRQSELSSWVRYQDGHPYVVWSSGLAEGSRYDIRSFRLSATFEALVEPDGTLVSAPRAQGAPPKRHGASPPESIGQQVPGIVTEASR